MDEYRHAADHGGRAVVSDGSLPVAFPAFFARAATAILLVDAGTGRVVEANPAAARLFGMEQAALAGLQASALIAPETAGPDAPRRLHAAGAQERWGLVAVTPLDAEHGGGRIDAIEIREVTGLHGAAAAWAADEALFRTAFMDAPVGIAVRRPDSVVLETNPALARMLGYDPGEMLALRPEDVFAPGYGQDVADIGDALLASPTGVVRLDRVYLRKDGTPLHARVTASAVRDASGQIARIVSHVEDVSELRLAEERLEASQEQLRSIFRDAAVGMAVIGPDARIVEANPVFAAMLGQRPEDLEGKTYRETTAPEFVEQNAALFASLRAGERDQFTLEKEYVRKDGSRFWGRLTVSAARGRDGRVLRYIGVIEDITALREAQEALAASEALFRSSFDRAAIGMAIANPGGVFIDANPALCAMLGYRRDDLVGRTFQEITPAEDLPPELPLMQRLLDGEADTYRMEKRLRRKDGRTIWIRLNVGCVRGPDGAITRGIAQIEDISEVHAAQEALAASEALFRSSFDGAAIGMGIADGTGVMLDLNPALCQMLGYRREELVGRSFQDFTADEALATEVAFLRRMIDGDADSYQMEKRYLRKDGSTFWARLNAGCVRGPDGAVTRLIGQIEDISVVRAAQQALAESERELRSSFDNAAVGMVMCDSSGRFMRVNPAFAAMLDYGQEELIGLRFLDVTHPEDTSESQTNWLQVIRGEIERFSLKKRYLRKDGETVWANLHVRAVRGAGGELLHTVAQMEDITAVHRAQAALTASEARFRAIVQNSSDVTVVFDNDLTVLWTSPSLSTVLGRDPASVIGRSALDLMHPEDAAAVRERISPMNGHTLAEGRMVVQFRMLHGDGSWRWVEALFDDPSTVAVVGGYVNHVRDITERKEAELAMQRALRLQQDATAHMQEVASQRTDFLAMVAHDFRTPLTAITGYADMLAFRFHDDPEALESATVIADSAQRLNRMVESLLHLDQLEGDLPPLNLSHADPVALVEGAVQQARSAWPGREVRLAVSPGLEALDLDEDLVTRAVGNLIDNAIKYSPGGQPVDVALQPDPGGFHLSVIDRGMGIPAKDLPRIFEKFARAEDAEVARIAGSGLGLPIVRAIARAHGGNAWAESEQSVGTTAHLVIRGA